MRKALVTICFGMVIAILLPNFFSLHYISAEAPNRELKDYSTTEIIGHFADEYGIDKKLFLRVAKCESSFKVNAIRHNDGGKGKHSVGVFQFQKSTFLHWEEKLGEDLNYDSAYDQAKLAAFMWKRKQQRQWTCYRNLV